MIANYTNHAANERTFLAWIRTGLVVAAFGLFLVKLSIFVDGVGGGSPHLLAEAAGAGVAVATRYAELAMLGIGIAVIASPLCVCSARSTAMKLFRFLSFVRRRCFPRRLRSP